MKTRREFLAGAGAGLAAGLAGCSHRLPVPIAPVAPLPESTTGPGSLKAHAAVRGFLYGCAVNTKLLASDAAYAQLVQEQSNIVVAENAMKWAPLRPTIDTYYFDEADALVAFAEKNRMKVRGHNLCWHRQLPAWFKDQATTANARGLLAAHIAQVVGRYAGRMHSWDVVNEAILTTDGRADGLRDSPWLKLVGADYIEQAFQAARVADPQALLTYNDYGIEGEDAASETKRAAVLVLLRRLKARHVPLDAVGIQSHITAGHTYGAGLTGFIAAARAMGLQVFLTEMDVNDREWPADDAIRDAAVADCYASFLDTALADPSVRVVLTWGITDRATWLNTEGARKDGLPERCLPFDRDGKAKKAFFAMRNSFDKRRAT
jgi:endo-1,4-beta-xylanase